MIESIVAVDSLAIQRSLTLLENRYRELREIGQKRFEDWEKETADLRQQLAAQQEALEQEKQARQRAERSLAEAEAALGAVSGSLRQLVQR